MSELLPSLPSFTPPERGGLTVRDAKRLVESFLAGRSPKTMRAYKGCLERIADYGGFKPEDFVREFFKGGLARANLYAHDFKAMMQKKSFAANYVNLHLSALRTLVRFGRRVGAVEWTLDVESEKRDPLTDTTGPGIAGVVAIIRAARAQKNPKTAARDVALFTLIFTVGLRRFEAAGLDLEHVDLKGGRCVWPLRKGRTQRSRLTIPDVAVDALKLWIEVRGSEAGPLFVSNAVARKRDDARLSENAIGWIVGRLAKKAGFDARAHGLRHAAATSALDLTGGDVRSVQRYMGHASPATTLMYDDARRDLAGDVANKVGELLRKKLEEDA